MARSLILVLLVLNGCSAMSGSGGGSAHVSQPMLSCGEAVRSARATVQRLGYTVTSVRGAAPGAPGQVDGERGAGASGGRETIRVVINCSDAGAELDATTSAEGLGSFGFSREFRDTLAGEVARKTERPRMASEEARGLVVKAEALRGDASQSVFGLDLPAAGITPLRIDIDNRSERRYRIDPSQIVLTTVQGQAQKPLPAQAAGQKLAAAYPEAIATVLQHELAPRDIAPGEKVSGYVFFPASSYRRARISLLDVASDEPEGFAIEF